MNSDITCDARVDTGYCCNRDRPYTALMIGGCGKWASRTYLPVFARSEQWRLVVADTNGGTAQFDDAPFVPLTGCFERDRDMLDTADRLYTPDIVIVSTPPETHYEYIAWALMKGADVVCDKPLVAIPAQFGSAQAAQILARQYASLCNLVEASVHRRHEVRSCNVYIPMKRRQDWPFGQILCDIKQVHDLTGIAPTFFNLTFNDGAYRFLDEYDRPGAHGYRAGLGILTHTGYHYLDYLAACLSSENDPVYDVDCDCVSSTTSGRAANPVDRAFAALLGRNDCPETEIQRTSLISRGELDVTLAYRLYLRSGQTCTATVSLLHHGASRRLSPRYAPDQTHDEGRVGDLSLTIQQGPFQSVQCLVADNAEGHGYARYIRRLHPIIARNLQADEIAIVDRDIPKGSSSLFYHAVVERILARCVSPAKPDVDDAVATYSLQRQATTMALYAKAMHARETRHAQAA